MTENNKTTPNEAAAQIAAAIANAPNVDTRFSAPPPKLDQPKPGPTVVLRHDGPTLAQWKASGMPEASYPPRGYAAKHEAGDNPVVHFRDGKRSVVQQDGSVKVVTVKEPDPHPLAQPDVQAIQQHKATRRKGSNGGCELCGHDLADHQKYMPDRNPADGAQGAGYRDVDSAEFGKYANALPRIIPKSEPEQVIDI